MRTWLNLALIFTPIFLLGCSGGSAPSCGKSALLLWPNATDKASFQEISFSTLSSLDRLQGSAAEIYYANGLDNSSFQGSVAEPHLTNAGGVCVPQDVPSSLALNAYAQFERLEVFENELGTKDQITWPRKVGVEILLKGRPFDVQNNAHYYGQQDVITLVPYTISSELPVSLNQGIVAHEHFHAHFQAQVVRYLNRNLGVSVEDLERSDSSSPEGLNNFVLRGWNEGLADFFAVTYTGSPNFFAASVKAPGRDVRLDIARFLTGDDFQAMAKNLTSSSTEKQFLNLTANAYGQGALLARLMWRLSRQSDGSPKAFLSRVMKRLPQLAVALALDYKTRVKSFSDVLPLLLKDETLSTQSCNQLRVAGGNEMVSQEFTQCAF